MPIIVPLKLKPLSISSGRYVKLLGTEDANTSSLLQPIVTSYPLLAKWQAAGKTNDLIFKDIVVKAQYLIFISLTTFKYFIDN